PPYALSTRLRGGAQCRIAENQQQPQQIELEKQPSEVSFSSESVDEQQKEQQAEEVPLMEDAEFNRRQQARHARVSSSSSSSQQRQLSSPLGDPSACAIEGIKDGRSRAAERAAAAPSLSPSPPPAAAAAVLVKRAAAAAAEAAAEAAKTITHEQPRPASSPSGDSNRDGRRSFRRGGGADGPADGAKAAPPRGASQKPPIYRSTARKFGAALVTEPPPPQVLELMPDATRALIENLRERTDYSVRVCAVTEEALQSLPPRHPARLARKLPADLSELAGLVDSAWMPAAHLLATTSGTLAPGRIRLAGLTDQAVKLRWQPPSVTGSNRLRGQVVRWAEVPDSARPAARASDWDGPSAADYVSLDPKDSKVTLEGLRPGTKYRIVVEAVVSVKTALDPSADGATAEEELRNRRTAHVSSDPAFVRTRCHVAQPRPMVAAVKPDSVLLHWERPYALAVVRPEQASERRYVRCHIEGYRLEINGKPYVSLRPDAQTCRLVKCRPGKLYSIVLVAVSQTDAAKKEARRLRKSRGSEQEQQICLYPDEPDETFSEPVEVRVPGGQLAAIREISAEFHLPDGDEAGGAGVGEVRLLWTLDDEFQGQVKQFNVTWSTDREAARAQRRVLDAAATSAALECSERGAVVTARLEALLTRETREPIVQQVQLTTPGPPAAPQIFLDAMSDREIVVEWSEPALFGGVGVAGYQTAGRMAPTRVQWSGGVGVAGYQLLVNGKAAGEPLEPTHRRAVIPCRASRHYRVQLVALSAHRDFPDSPPSAPLFISTYPNMPAVSEAPPPDFADAEAEGDALAGDLSEIPLTVSARTDSTLTVEWMAYQPPDGVHSFALQWSSPAQPAERTETLAHQERSCLLQNLLPGTVYSLRLSALDSNRAVVEKSRALRAQTCAPIDTPLLRLRACNFSYIAVHWTEPRHYGDAAVAGYKVFINGVVEETLGAGETSYTYCKGRWCQDYSFQVQAISNDPRFNSKPSDSLLVTWPGCLPGELRPLAGSVSGAARVAWPAPFLTEGVKLKQFRLICKLADTGQVIRVVGPLHPETREAEVTGLRSGTYHLQLEVQLHGTQMAVLSAALTVQPTLTPDPPTVTVSVVGLEQRRQLEAAVCRLVNRRDRHIMDSLEDCFKSLEAYTGEFVLQVSWACPQSNQEVPLSGYRVLVDGRQYGSALHQGMSSVRIKLSTDRPSHAVSMVALCESQGTQSPESNMVEVLTDPFQPMAFYCIHEVHCGEKWPKKGCCLYQETLAVERRNFLNYYNPGFLNQFVPAPAAHVQQLPGGERQRLFPPGGPKSVTLLCFWTRWCVASIRYVKFFVRLAAELRRQFDFVAIATQRFDNAHERSALQHCIKELALETDGLTHVYAVDRVKGSSYIAWRGRYCALDYSSFEEEMSQVLRSVKDKTRLDDQLSVENGQPAVDHSHAKRAYDDSNVALHPANSFAGTAGSKKPSKQSPAKISISTRPYSGRPSSASASGGGGGGGSGGGASQRRRRSGSAKAVERQSSPIRCLEGLQSEAAVLTGRQLLLLAPRPPESYKKPKR
uniref:Fibronectin type-III domain-containing protein n=1 Tax=Macrostomum lignano TaxID=282301 RepID=A0A1I8ITX6_9PLAT